MLSIYRSTDTIVAFLLPICVCCPESIPDSQLSRIVLVRGVRIKVIGLLCLAFRRPNDVLWLQIAHVMKDLESVNSSIRSECFSDLYWCLRRRPQALLIRRLVEIADEVGILLDARYLISLLKYSNGGAEEILLRKLAGSRLAEIAALESAVSNMS